MKIAIVGSRGLNLENLDIYLPPHTSEIVSGGAKGIDTCAKEYALLNRIKYTEFLPDYRRYGKGAPIIRNIEIINYADEIIAFWDGKSKGTNNIIERCHKLNKKLTVVILK